MEELEFILIIVFTVAYIIVIIIQKNQIKALREHNHRANAHFFRNINLTNNILCR